MELKDTIELMKSEDYKDRFKLDILKRRAKLENIDLIS